MSLFARWPRQLEVDFQRYYGLDLADVWRGELSWRRVMVLSDGLPAESSFRSAVADMPPITGAEARLIELWEAKAGKDHPIRDLVGARAKAVERAERDEAMERQRAAARERNAAAIERQRQKLLSM
ncbi:hypothetical protein [Corynebacterium kalidii]